jgi:hypothetical protein
MGYVRVIEQNGRDGSVDAKFNRTYQRQFLVEVDANTYGPWYATGAPGIPRIFNTHNEDTNAYCVNVVPTQDREDPTLFRVTAHYGYNLDGWAAGGNLASTGNPWVDSQQAGLPIADRVENPLLRPRDYDFATVVSGQEVLEFDVNGRPLLNTAGDPFFPPYTIEKPAVNLIIGLNSTDAPGDVWAAYYNYLNAAPMAIGPWTYAAKRARLRSVTAKRVNEQNVSYWRWMIAFEVRQDWRWRPRSQGYQAYINRTVGGVTVKKKELIKDAAQVRVAHPVGLDVDGYRCVVTESVVMGETIRTDNTYQHAWDVLPTMTFPSPL